jgi:DNA-binding SARP family transcriptional activator
MIGAAPFKLDRERYEPHIAAARNALGEETIGRVWAEGGEMTPEQAIDFALASREPAPVEPPPTAPAPPPRPESAPPVAVAASTAAPTLQVHTLGPLRISIEGAARSADVWRYTRPRELLLYLLANPEGRTKEQIGLLFWPDASPAQVKNSFHVTLHHLRKVLGRSEWIIFENERYRINPELGYDFDAALFEQEITAALRQTRAGEAPADRLRAALALYRGDFLEEESAGDWHLEIRDHLRRLHVEGLFALGELLMQSEQFREAAEVYQKIVQKEDLQEEAHRRLMLCRARMGQRAEALRHYERLVRLLAAELDAEPEEETTALYDRLRQAEPV